MKGGVEGTHEAARRVPGAAQGGAAPPALLVVWWWPPFPLLVILEGSLTLIFNIIFPEFFWALLMAGKPEIQKQQKTGTGNWVH